MQFFTTALSLALLAGSALALSAQIEYPPAGASSPLAKSSSSESAWGYDYPENIDVAAIIIGLSACTSGTCTLAKTAMGTVLLQGSYTAQPENAYADYTVTVPQGFTAGKASLNVISLFMIGAEYAPNVDYLNEGIMIAANN